MTQLTKSLKNKHFTMTHSNKLAKYLIVLLGFLCFENCKKNDTDLSDKRIIGSWNWIDTYNDGTPSDSNPLTHQKSGITEVINFYPNHTFSDIKDGIKIDTGTFSLGHGIATDYFGSKEGYDSVKMNGLMPGITFHDVICYTITGNDSLAFGGFPFIIGSSSKFWTRE